MQYNIEEIINEFIIKKNLNIKNNNYAFLNLSKDQMEEFKIVLFNNAIAKIESYPEEWHEYHNVGSLNLIYDCLDDGIGNLLDYKKLNVVLKKLYSHTTINVLNLQETEDKEKLKQLNDSIIKTGEHISFNLFTKDQYLKESHSTDGKILDWRDDLNMVSIDPINMEKNYSKIKIR